MALQDSVHAYNLTVDNTKKIHIRIAANRGEIRVTENDIFGEPINVSSRIESITPTDEIYLSETLYTSINKSIVPAQEVGLQEFSGELQATRIYNIPRYLMPQLMSPTGGQGTLYPYGGMHYPVKTTKSQSLLQFFKNIPLKWAFIAVPVFLILLFAGITVYRNSDSIISPTANASITANTNPYLGEISEQQPLDDSSETAMQVLTNILSSRPKLPEPKIQVESKKRYKPKSSSTRRRSSNWNISTAKSAYRSKQLSKTSYKQIVYDLKTNYKSKIRRLKTDYRNNKISKAQYKQAVTKAKRQLKGR
jgi:hypothetical protein